MNVYYFKIEAQHMAPKVVAIFGESPERALQISERLMLNFNGLHPKYSGAGLDHFRQSGNPDELREALANARVEGVAGYSIDGGWSVLPVPETEPEKAS